MHCGKKFNLIWVNASNLEGESKQQVLLDFTRHARGLTRPWRIWGTGHGGYDEGCRMGHDEQRLLT